MRLPNCLGHPVYTVLTVSVQLWNDYQLRWRKSDYGDITVIRVPAEKVWKPDIVLFNKSVVVFIARCTLVQSAVLRSHVVCLSVRPSVCNVGGL